MNYIFAVNIDGLEETFENALKLVSKNRQQEVLCFRQEKDRQRKLISVLLLRYLAKEYLNISDYTVSTNSFGKPFLEDHLEFQFNVSHSGNWVAAAVANKPVGIDVELINETKDFMEIAKRFYSEEEYVHLAKEPNDTSKLASFYDIWTKKESLIKAVGKGLSIPLKSFTVPFKEEGIVRYNDFNWNIKVPEFCDKKYKLAICLSEKLSSILIKYLSIKDLL